eukprot:189980-Pyramimonas_sp.AAC.1
MWSSRGTRGQPPCAPGSKWTERGCLLVEGSLPSMGLHPMSWPSGTGLELSPLTQQAWAKR